MSTHTVPYQRLGGGHFLAVTSDRAEVYLVARLTDDEQRWSTHLVQERFVERDEFGQALGLVSWSQQVRLDATSIAADLAFSGDATFLTAVNLVATWGTELATPAA